LVYPGFSSRENNGRDLFVANCSKCHSPIRAFQDVFEACNGLDLEYVDQGRGKLTGNASDNGVFKAPSLRNIAVTAPYMHDGRFKTLEEVIEFYSTGVKNHPNLHPQMLHNGDPNLHLSTQQKQDLIAFLKTLTDNKLATDYRFSNPFKQ
jgi:cytochrome c peroxidase